VRILISIFGLLLAAVGHAQQLTVDEIVQRLTAAHSQLRTVQRPHVSTRSYHVTKSGDDRASMTAILRRPAPAEMSFQIVESTGGTAENAVRKSLEKEVQITREPSISEVSPRNYEFTLLGQESLDGKDCYVLRITPHQRSKDLVEGRIWVDRNRFLIRKLEGKPSKNPSFWVKDLNLTLSFGEMNGVWVQLRSDVKLHIRLAGEYQVQAKNVSLTLLAPPVEIAQRQRAFRRTATRPAVYLRPAAGMQP